MGTAGGLGSKLTLVEWDATIGLGCQSEPGPGCGVVRQKADECAERFLDRSLGLGRALRETGYQIDAIQLLVGGSDSARLLQRVELACSLSQLLADGSTLHLVFDGRAAPQGHWFEFVGWLLADQRWRLGVRLALHDHASPGFAPSLQPKAQPDPRHSLASALE